MRDSPRLEAERGVQPLFSKALPWILLPGALLMAFAWGLQWLPNRTPLPPRSTVIRFEPVRIDPAGLAPLRLAGAWRVSSDDPRFGGISALGIERSALVALTDSGAIIRFGRPSGRTGLAHIRDLPAGPGKSPRFKHNRDSEALLRDPARRGWWVAFEHHHQLWLFDSAFRRPLERIDLGKARWESNSGLEALSAWSVDLVAFPERANQLLRIHGMKFRVTRLAHSHGRLSDATMLPDGNTILLANALTPSGFKTTLVPLARNGGAGAPITLRIGWRDNFEAIAAEPRADGGIRLWLMTDDGFQWPMRTLLVALDLPAVPRAGPA